MSKLSRNVLKEIVKECIIEIFGESFFTSGNLVNENRKRKNSLSKTQKRPRTNSNQRRQHHLDNVSYGASSNESGQNMTENKRFERKIDKITSTLTNDPVMANIFKDTAATTLQQQNSSTGRNNMVISGGDPASMKVSNSDPTELFAESAGKWATLAFSSPVKR